MISPGHEKLYDSRMTEPLHALEVELKLALPAQQVPAFLRSMARRRSVPQKQILHTRYFDTPDFLLGGQGLALRVRRAGRRWLQTLKTEGQRGGGLSTRVEYETPTRHGVLDWTRFPETAQARVPEQLRPDLVVLFETRFTRTTWQIAGHDRAQIELALDVGEVCGDDRCQPICEIELELKSGGPAALFALARDWARRFDLLPLDVSKAERGLRLARGEAPGAVKSASVPLQRGMTVEVGFAAICQSCLDQFQANLHGILFVPPDVAARPLPNPPPRAGEGASVMPKPNDDEVEYVHQARVALRRLRAGLRVYRRACQLPPDLLDGLRTLVAALGPARDWDVLLSETLPAIAPHYGDGAAWQDWTAALLARRRAVRAVMREDLLLARPGAWLLAFQQWLSQRGWRAAEAKVRLRQMAPQIDAARRTLKRGHGGIVDRAREFERMTAPERHALRIAFKRQRYAVEFFQGLFPGRRQTLYLQLARDIQDSLGRANDAHVAETLLAGSGLDSGRAGGFARGWLAAQVAAGAGRESAALLQQFAGLRPYW